MEAFKFLISRVGKVFCSHITIKAKTCLSVLFHSIPPLSDICEYNFTLCWSSPLFQTGSSHSLSSFLRPPGWDSSRILSVSLYTPASPAGPLILLLHPCLPPLLYSALLPAAWAIYRPCFISTPAGRQSCHSGPTEPLWNTAWEWKCTLLMQELILVTLSRRTRMILFCWGCAVQYVVQR